MTPTDALHHLLTALVANTRRLDQAKRPLPDGLAIEANGRDHDGRPIFVLAIGTLTDRYHLGIVQAGELPLQLFTRLNTKCPGVTHSPMSLFGMGTGPLKLSDSAIYDHADALLVRLSPVASLVQAEIDTLAALEARRAEQAAELQKQAENQATAQLRAFLGQ